MYIELRDDALVLTNCSDPRSLGIVRGLPSRRYSQVSGHWLAEHTIENLSYLARAGVDVRHIPPATNASYRVEAHGGLLRLFVPATQANIATCRAIPDYRMWSLQVNAWVLKPTPRNLQYLQDHWPQLQWQAAAQQYIDRLAAIAREREEFALQKVDTRANAAGVTVTDYQFGTKPMQHQVVAFKLARDREEFALLMEQGTGKTKILIDNACWLYGQGLIDAVLVIAPNSVKTNWVTDEIPLHTPAHTPYHAAYWSASANKAQRAAVDRVLDSPVKALRWLVVNVEGLIGDRCLAACERLLKEHRCAVFVDESSRIKSPKAARTKTTIRLGKKAKYRRIATGTPITQGPLDLYTQFAFLNPTILGFGSYYAFRNHFALLGGWNGKQIMAYTNLPELQVLTDPFSYRVTKAECLDLPPKVYQKLEVDLSAEQQRLYNELRREMLAEFQGRELSVTMVLVQQLRLQQVTGGFIPLPADNEDGTLELEPIHDAAGEKNPKIAALLDLADDAPGKMIVWARFRAETTLIANQLRKKYGPEAVVEFHGGCNDDQRIAARTSFQDPTSPVRFFVGQVDTGGLGITLTQAETVVYYSNTFSLETRLQSEDRAHRIGQSRTVTYIDLVARGTTDLKIMRALRGKKSLADQFTGDAALADWLS